MIPSSSSVARGVSLRRKTPSRGSALRNSVRSPGRRDRSNTGFFHLQHPQLLSAQQLASSGQLQRTMRCRSAAESGRKADQSSRAD